MPEPFTYDALRRCPTGWVLRHAGQAWFRYRKHRLAPCWWNFATREALTTRELWAQLAPGESCPSPTGKG